ncbi:MAG: hypothetical protein DCC49_06700 [Acidobacteria bacterium]|nr:MAG: hypothetical protein DCC49_06700 [Acidobacteriota bacterium]
MTLVLTFFALPASAASDGSVTGPELSAASSGIHAQVTVDPSAPKRNFEEVEDRPWTLLMAKALMPLVLVLLVFVIVWYIWKVSRARATTS